MVSMSKVVGVVVGITVSVILIATVLAPTISEYTASGKSLASYAGLLSAVLVLCVVGTLMLAVKLISSSRD